MTITGVNNSSSSGVEAENQLCNCRTRYSCPLFIERMCKLLIGLWLYRSVNYPSQKYVPYMPYRINARGSSRPVHTHYTLAFKVLSRSGDGAGRAIRAMPSRSRHSLGPGIEQASLYAVYPRVLGLL